MRQLALRLALALAAAGCSGATPRARPREMVAGAILGHIAYLADDALEGRDSGTAGGELAEEYILEQLQGLGLDAVESQPFQFAASSRLGPENRLEIDGQPLEGSSFRPYSFSAGGTAAGAAVFAGYGIVSGEAGRDDYAGVEVKGRVVVVLSGAPPGEDPHGKLASHRSARAKALQALARKAAALLILAAVDRSSALPAFEGEEVSSDVGLPVLAVDRAAAARPLGLDLAREEQPAAGAGKTGRLLGRQVRLQADVRLEKRTARNILGWLSARGPEARDELVIVGAHHDGLGRGIPGSLRRERHGEVYNGADDNASGVAGVIELARRLEPRAGELRRSILFMTFTGEERGLLGSKWFTQHPLLRIPRRGLARLNPFAAALKPVAMVNLDMIGRLRDRKLLASGVATSEGWPAVLSAAEERIRSRVVPPLQISLDRTEDIFGSSDHLSFYQMGLPVLFVFTGSHPEYHTPDDDLYRATPSGERTLLIDPVGERDVLALVEEVLVDLATRPDPLPLKRGVELAPRMSFKVVLRLMPDYGAGTDGMRIASVTPGGPAALAGLKPGDVIVRMGATPVKSVQDYMVGLEQAQAGREIEVEFVRDGARQTTRVVPAALSP